MKSALDWEFTVTFRPVRVLAQLAMAALVAAMVVALGAACLLSTARPEPVAVVPAVVAVVPAVVVVEKSPEQVSRETAVKAVDKVISDRMSYLDRDRRVLLAHTIVDESLACGLDPLFTLALGDVESRMDHEAVSPTGARGLYQLMPRTWDWEVQRRGLGRLEKFNVVHNAKVGIGYLCYLSTMFKRPDSLLLAYNQGPGGASDILAKRAEPSEEAATYAAKVWRSYQTLLAAFALPNDGKTMRQLYKSPERTVYATIIGGTHADPMKPPMKLSSVKPRHQPVQKAPIPPSTPMVATVEAVIQPMFVPMGSAPNP